MNDEAYPEILTLDLGDDFLRGLESLVEYARPHLSWRRFGLIPSELCAGSPVSALRDLVRTVIGRRYIHLSPSAAQRQLLGWFLPERRWQSRSLFRFLCLNDPLDLSALDAILGTAACRDLLGAGIFIRRGDSVRLPVTLIPYEDHYYLGEAAHFLRHRSLYPITPVHVSPQAFLQVECYRRLFRRLAPKRILEIGAGIGLVALELRTICEVREGAEIYQRNVDFAVANAKLRRDASVRFYRSDLFQEVKGRFDIIFFNPWQPTARYLDLVLTFLERAPEYLEENGHIGLLIHSSSLRGSDPVLASLAGALERQSLQAMQYIAAAWSATNGSGDVTTDHHSFLVIHRRRGTGPTIVTQKNLPALIFFAKRFRDALRRQSAH